MSNLYHKYTTWNQYEKKLLKDPEFVKAVQEVEPEYQVAKSLIEARLKKGLSQSELAAIIGTKQPVISRLESGTHPPTISLLTRLAAALDSRLIIRFE